MTVLSARADVPTETPGRYAKQLLSHLGQRVAWTTVGATSTAEIAGGTGRVVVGDGVLTLMAEAPDPETLSQVQFVLGSHVERFGQRNHRHLGQRCRPPRCTDSDRASWSSASRPPLSWSRGTRCDLGGPVAPSTSASTRSKGSMAGDPLAVAGVGGPWRVVTFARCQARPPELRLGTRRWTRSAGTAHAKELRQR